MRDFGILVSEPQAGPTVQGLGPPIAFALVQRLAMEKLVAKYGAAPVAHGEA
jgi:hypothetical protein